MFGLEKKPKSLFEFDLEKDLKEDKEKTQELLKSVEAKIIEIKNILRQGTASEEYDQYGILLHGYVALQKVLKKVVQK
jgi:hypothetical protein